MRNLELKARYANLTHAEAIARSIGATFGGELRQTDTYFHAPYGRLKLREVQHIQPDESADVFHAELIAYQRPETAATRWSDYITSVVTAPDTLREALARALGVRQIVTKTRRLYRYKNSRIHLDCVVNLGNFIEFEALADDGDESRARAVMGELMQAFGLQASDAITSSYGEMML
jgi:predicted adenylyl cyclase CyaB